MTSRQFWTAEAAEITEQAEQSATSAVQRARKCLTYPLLTGIISTNVLCPRRIATSDHRARVWRSLRAALFSAQGSEQADGKGIIEGDRRSRTGGERGGDGGRWIWRCAGSRRGDLGWLSRTPYCVGGLRRLAERAGRGPAGSGGGRDRGWPMWRCAGSSGGETWVGCHGPPTA